MVEIEKQALIQILGINTNKKGLTLAADYIRREHPV